MTEVLAIVRRAALIVSIGTVLILVSGCATSPSPTDAPDRASMVGYWYVELVDVERGSTVNRLTHRREDGTWIRHTREFLDDGTIHSSEISGEWWLDNDIYQWRVQRMAEQPAPDQLRRLLFEYVVLSIGGESFVYREKLPGAEPVREHRVDKEFRLP